MDDNVDSAVTESTEQSAAPVANEQATTAGEAAATVAEASAEPQSQDGAATELQADQPSEATDAATSVDAAASAEGAEPQVAPVVAAPAAPPAPRPVIVRGLIRHTKLTPEQRIAAEAGTLAHLLKDCRDIAARCAAVADSFDVLAAAADADGDEDRAYRLEDIAERFRGGNVGILRGIEGL